MIVKQAEAAEGGKDPMSVVHEGQQQQQQQQQAGADHLMVKGSRCIVISAVLLNVRFLCELMQCAVNIPHLTMDVMQRVAELLRTFNEHSCLLILGAGAIRTAGLETITSKHLVLASQALEVLILLTPMFKAILKARLTLKQEVLLSELERVWTVQKDDDRMICAPFFN